jgi:hypothetical protein
LIAHGPNRALRDVGDLYGKAKVWRLLSCKSSASFILAQILGSPNALWRNAQAYPSYW